MWPFDQNNAQMYQQYAQAYDTGDYGGFDQNQVLGNVQQFMAGAPSDMQQDLFQQHFEQMPYEQRMIFAQQLPPEYGVDPNDTRSMSRGFARMGRERPDMLRQILNHPLLLGAGVGLAGMIAKHMMHNYG
ncbi:MAG TPA: hypothetical protein VH593_15290 [Ktedonobacteraceae bacterium]|jgi:hypothetical protein